jgi:hypothetical protein
VSGAPPKKDLDAHAAALVNRARVGDQNAMALIKKVGVRARSGDSGKARKAFAAISRFIEKNPVMGVAGTPPNEGGQFGYGGTVSATIPPAPQALVDTAFSGEGRERHGGAVMDRRQELPPLPKGALDRLFDPDSFQKIVIACCKYNHGLDAAAVVLAAGPTLSAEDVQGLGMSGFGSEAATQAFFMGVKYPLAQDMVRMKDFDVVLKRAFVIGQCVGRAWRIQAVRRPGSRIGLWSPGAGWELGEPFAVSARSRQGGGGGRAPQAPQKRRWSEPEINRDTELGQMS